jgi:hypothetical protein
VTLQEPKSYDIQGGNEPDSGLGIEETRREATSDRVGIENNDPAGLPTVPVLDNHYVFSR